MEEHFNRFAKSLEADILSVQKYETMRLSEIEEMEMANEMAERLVSSLQQEVHHGYKPQDSMQITSIKDKASLLMQLIRNEENQQTAAQAMTLLLQEKFGKDRIIESNNNKLIRLDLSKVEEDALEQSQRTSNRDSFTPIQQYFSHSLIQATQSVIAQSIEDEPCQSNDGDLYSSIV